MQVHLGDLYVCFSSERRGKISCDEIEKILGRTCCSRSREDLGSAVHEIEKICVAIVWGKRGVQA